MTNYNHEIVQPIDSLPIWYALFNENKTNATPSIILPHWHRGIELSYTYSGKIDEFVINKQIFHTQAERLLLINSCEIHSIKTTTNGSALSIIFPYSYVKSFFPEIDGFNFELNDPNCFTPEQQISYRKIQNDCREFYNIAYEKANYYHFDLSILFLKILKQLVKNFHVVKQHASPKSVLITARLQQITDYLEAHFHESFSLDDLANHMHLSKEYLSRFFKQHMQMTIGDYLRNIRAQAAYNEIIHSSETLTNIALMSGFSGLRSMNRALENSYFANATQIRKKSLGKKNLPRDFLYET